MPGGAGAAGARVPLLLPDRLPENRVLLELGPLEQRGGTAGAPRATDLSGDSGAVGRVNVLQPPGGPSAMQIDLKGTARGREGQGLPRAKGWGRETAALPCTGLRRPAVLPTPAHPPLCAGVLYDAALLPCPMTLATLAVSGTEARVESLFQAFIQMRWALFCV